MFGCLKGEDTLFDTENDTEQNLGIYHDAQGSNLVEVSELHAGDIGAIAKLSGVKTGDTLSTKNTPVLFGKTEYSTPYTYMKYVVKAKGDEDKGISGAGKDDGRRCDVESGK